MPALTSPASAVEPKPASSRTIRLDLILVSVFLAAIWFILTAHLSSEWTVNEQYNYGCFVPFFVAYLFWLRWERRPEPDVSRRSWLPIAIAIGALILLLPIRLFEIGNPDWRPISWLHASVVVVLTLIVIWLVGGRPWLRQFAFPIVFFLVAVPWITPVEEPIIQGLMKIVAAIATEIVGLLGIPAEVEGNLIRIQNGLVGVSEACSGVRSLQTSLMIGLLFGELKRLTVRGRVALVLLAIAIALVGNLGRAVFLVWIAATRSISEVEHWHDLAGYIITGIVFLSTMTLAAWMGKGSDRFSGDGSPANREVPRFSSCWSMAGVVWLIVIEFTAGSWYRSHEKDLAATAHWNVRWPESAPGFHNIKIQETIKNTLRFNEGREVAWPENVDAPDPGMNLLYFFRWKPGTTTVLRARAHRPDICLPSAGWRQTADEGVRRYAVTEDFEIPFRHFAFAREGTTHSSPIFAHAFFCLREETLRPKDPTHLNSESPGGWSRSDRWRVVREGIRNPGQQVMEFFFVSQHQRSSAEAEEEFARLIPGLVRVESKKQKVEKPQD